MEPKITIKMTVIAITALAMMGAPAILTTTYVFALNPFDVLNNLNIPHKSLFNNFVKDLNTPNSNSGNIPTTHNPPPTKHNPPPTDNGNSGKQCIPGKCLGTKGYYTQQGHHHCYAGSPMCSKNY